MTAAFVRLEGAEVESNALRLRRSREVLAAIEARGSYASLVECRVAEGHEIIIFDVEVQRPQRPVHEIQKEERIAVRFSEQDDIWPEVLALRVDFPLVPHLNMRQQELPRSLCVYEHPWAEIRLSWNGASFVEEIRLWLAQTARGELHGPDQPLEPLMFSHGYDLVVGSKFGFKNGHEWERVALGLIDGREGRVFVAESPENPMGEMGQKCLALFLQTPPRCHGVVHRAPKTLQDLASLVDSDEFDLLEALRSSFREIPEDIRKDKDLPKVLLPLLVLAFPKTRAPGGRVETNELMGFVCTKSLESVGVSMGAWAVFDGHIGLLIGRADSADGSEVPIAAVNVVRMPTWEAMATLNGLKRRNSMKILAIGAGALGSQVAMNLARAGFGTWTVVDNDTFMPHNSARHAFIGKPAVGHNKAKCLELYMNSLADDEPLAQGVPSDFLNPGDFRESLDDAIASTELVLDMSASVPVARELAGRDLHCRAVSLFLSPNGRDLVLLAEDEKREFRLDELEMLYYAAVAVDAGLEGHLSSPEGRVRYGASCRDVSSRIAQADVGAHAGIGASAIMQSAGSSDASLRIWRKDPKELSVRALDFPVERFVRQERNGWGVRISDSVLRTVATLREEGLPNETGGILIGSIDHDRRCVYLCLALPSPPDSEEWPSLYIRGVEGLAQARRSIHERTLGNLDYLGEWHSHPDGSSALPSDDDRQAFEWIRNLASGEGRPPVMLICGESDIEVFVETLP